MDIVSLLIGGGLVGALSATIIGVLNYRTAKTKGLLEKEAAAENKLVSENTRAVSRADAAEVDADRARAETEKWRERVNSLRDEVAYYRRILIEKGILRPNQKYLKGDNPHEGQDE